MTAKSRKTGEDRSVPKRESLQRESNVVNQGGCVSISFNPKWGTDFWIGFDSSPVSPRSNIKVANHGRHGKLSDVTFNEM